MTYEYSGYLETVLDAPEPGIRDELDCVVFDADALYRWQIEEHDRQRDGEHIPVLRTRVENAVRLEGQFENIRRLDLAPDERQFWVSLSSARRKDDRFPVDVVRYPVVEATYRCVSPNACPAWLWTYVGGVNLSNLSSTREWRTVARCVSHMGFPQQVDSLTFRLYSTSRTTEAMEIESVRFRAMSPRETEAVSNDWRRIETEVSCPRYPVLDAFLPLGTFLHAKTAAHLAQTLGLSFEEYWDLVMEDVARHRHNTIVLERADVLPSSQFRTLLGLAERYRVKLIPMYEFRLGGGPERAREFARSRVAPYADSSGVLAWSFYMPPSERGFTELIRAKQIVEDSDPNHPVVHIAQYPNAFPLFGRCFAASAVAYTAGHVPWGVSEMIRQHMPLSKGQQFWLVAPGFILLRDAPDWNGAPELRLVMNLAFGNGVKGWFSYAYHNDLPWVNGSSRRSLTGPFLTFSDLWAELGHRGCQFNALAPLFVNAQFEPSLQEWFASSSVRHARSQLPEHIPATSVFHLQGPDYSVYCVISNDTTEMATEAIDISDQDTRGLSFYDVTDFVRDRFWTPMARTRRLEMFPGQVHVILAAEPEVCARWRDVIASRITEDDARQLAIDLKLAREYGISLGEFEGVAEHPPEKGDVMARLAIMKQARNTLVDLIYDCSDLRQAQSKILEASAALSGCDFALGALVGHGKVDEAAALGRKVIPMASELAHLRLELRRGRGGAIREACADLAARTVKGLSEVRAAR
jgi:hypothetical protein